MKKTKKILISVLTAGCLASAAFGLAACGGGDETAETPETPATPSGDYVVYTVTFDTNGGTLLPEQGAEAGDKAIKPGDPKKAGYIFGGWYANAACTQQYDFNSGITGNTTIYAKWDAAPTTDAEYFRLTQDGEGWSVAAMPGKIMPTDVVIPATIDDKTITSVAVSGFEDVGNVQSVTLPDSITSIGQRAFRNCTDLEVVIGGANVEMIDSDAFDNTVWDNNLPAGEVYLGKTLYKYASSIFVETAIEVKEGTVGIASGAFLNQPNLVGVTLPDSLKYIGSYAFGADTEENGNGVTEVVIPDSVVEVGAAAFRYAPIETLIIGKGVEYIGEKAFVGADITYLEFNTPNGVIADAQFSGMTSPAMVKIANEVKTFPENLVKGWDGIVSLDLGTGITVIPAGALDGHTALSELKFGNLTRIGGNAFRGTGLSEITLPASLSRLGNNAFANCENLETVTVNAEKVGISGSAFPAFAGDEKLTSVKFGATVREIPDYLFYQNVNITSLAFGQGVEKIGMYAFYGVSLSGKLVLPEGLKYIGDHAFDAGDDSTNPGYGTTPLANLQGVVVPTTVEEIGSEAFANNRTLTYVAWNAVSVKTSVYTPRDSFTVNTFKSAFTGCKDLKYVTVGSAVKSLPEQFIKGCNKVDEVDLGGGSIKIGANAFEGCTALVSLGAANGSGISDVGTDAFKGTPWYNDVLSANDGKPYYIGKVLMGISGTVTDETYTLTVSNSCARIADNAFKNDKKLTQITFSGSDGKIVIGTSAFEGCTGLTGKLSTGRNVTEIGNRAFYGCTGLTELTLTNVETIGDAAFRGCNKLYTTGDFEIPASVKTIGKEAFYDMKLVGKLTTASNSVLEKIDNQAFYNANPTEIVLSDTCTYLGTQWINNASKTTKFEALGVTYAGSLPFGSSPIADTFSFDQFTEIGSLSGWKRTEYVFENLTKIGTSFLGGGVNTSKQQVTGNTYVTKVTFKQPIEEIPATAFAGTTALKEVVLEYPEALKTIGAQAFHSSAIEKIDISHVIDFGGACFAKSFIQLEDFEFNEDLENLGDDAFHGAYDVKGTITIRGKLDTIGQSAFEDCPIQKVIIGGGVKTVGYRAFARLADTNWKRSDMSAYGEKSDEMYMSEVIFEEGVQNVDPQAFRYRYGDVVSFPSTILTVGGYGATDDYTAQNLGFRMFSVIKFANYVEPSDLNSPTAPFVPESFFIAGTAEAAEKMRNSAVWDAYRDNVFAASELVGGDWIIDADGKVLKYLGDKTNISIPAEAKSMDSIAIILGDRAPAYAADITITVAADSGFKYENGMLTSKDGTALYFYNGTETTVTDNTVTTVKGYAFAYNGTITTLTFNQVTDWGEYAANSAMELLTVTAPLTKTVGDYAFTNVTAANSYPTGNMKLATFNFEKLETVGKYSFARCAFTTITLPEIVTIGANAFANNSSLETLTIGEKCTTIGSSAFNSHKSGMSVTVKATTPPKRTGNVFGTKATITALYVPETAISEYQSVYSTYSDKIQAIVAD